MTSAGLRELRVLTALTFLDLHECSHVTNEGLQHLTSLHALTELRLYGTFTNECTVGITPCNAQQRRRG